LAFAFVFVVLPLTFFVDLTPTVFVTVTVRPGAFTVTVFVAPGAVTVTGGPPACVTV
jgi:hypothetical protein